MQFTRRDCCVLGAKVFAIGACSPVVPLVILALRGDRFHTVTFNTVAVFAYLTIPISAVFGWVLGFANYRLALGSTELGAIEWWQWTIFLVCTGGVGMPFLLSSMTRNNVIVNSDRPTWILPVVYGCFILAVGAGYLLFGNDTGQMPAAMGLCSIVSMFASDVALMNLIAMWHDQDRLAPPTSHNVQFSLSAMMISVMSFGAWITGLVIMARA